MKLFIAACDCDKSGSTGCNEFGKCECKPTVEGKRCDKCKSGYYGFSSSKLNT